MKNFAIFFSIGLTAKDHLFFKFQQGFQFSDYFGSITSVQYDNDIDICIGASMFFKTPPIKNQLSFGLYIKKNYFSLQVSSYYSYFVLNYGVFYEKKYLFFLSFGLSYNLGSIVGGITQIQDRENINHNKEKIRKKDTNAQVIEELPNVFASNFKSSEILKGQDFNLKCDDAELESDDDDCVMKKYFCDNLDLQKSKQDPLIFNIKDDSICNQEDQNSLSSFDSLLSYAVLQAKLNKISGSSLKDILQCLGQLNNIVSDMYVGLAKKRENELCMKSDSVQSFVAAKRSKNFHSNLFKKSYQSLASINPKTRNISMKNAKQTVCARVLDGVEIELLSQNISDQYSAKQVFHFTSDNRARNLFRKEHQIEKILVFLSEVDRIQNYVESKVRSNNGKSIAAVDIEPWNSFEHDLYVFEILKIYLNFNENNKKSLKDVLRSNGEVTKQAIRALFYDVKQCVLEEKLKEKLQKVLEEKSAGWQTKQRLINSYLSRIKGLNDVAYQRFVNSLLDRSSVIWTLLQLGRSIDEGEDLSSSSFAQERIESFQADQLEALAFSNWEKDLDLFEKYIDFKQNKTLFEKNQFLKKTSNKVTKTNNLFIDILKKFIDNFKYKVDRDPSISKEKILNAYEKVLEKFRKNNPSANLEVLGKAEEIIVEKTDSTTEFIKKLESFYNDAQITEKVETASSELNVDSSLYQKNKYVFEQLRLFYATYKLLQQDQDKKNQLDAKKGIQSECEQLVSVNALALQNHDVKTDLSKYYLRSDNGFVVDFDQKISQIKILNDFNRNLSVEDFQSTDLSRITWRFRLVDQVPFVQYQGFNIEDFILNLLNPQNSFARHNGTFLESPDVLFSLYHLYALYSESIKQIENMRQAIFNKIINNHLLSASQDIQVLKNKIYQDSVLIRKKAAIKKKFYKNDCVALYANQRLKDFSYILEKLDVIQKLISNNKDISETQRLIDQILAINTMIYPNMLLFASDWPFILELLKERVLNENIDALKSFKGSVTGFLRYFISDKSQGLTASEFTCFNWDKYKTKYSKKYKRLLKKYRSDKTKKQKYKLRLAKAKSCAANDCLKNFVQNLSLGDQLTLFKGIHDAGLCCSKNIIGDKRAKSCSRIGHSLGSLYLERMANVLNHFNQGSEQFVEFEDLLESDEGFLYERMRIKDIAKKSHNKFIVLKDMYKDLKENTFDECFELYNTSITKLSSLKKLYMIATYNRYLKNTSLIGKTIKVMEQFGFYELDSANQNIERFLNALSFDSRKYSFQEMTSILRDWVLGLKQHCNEMSHATSDMLRKSTEEVLSSFVQRLNDFVCRPLINLLNNHQKEKSKYHGNILNIVLNWSSENSDKNSGDINAISVLFDALKKILEF